MLTVTSAHGVGTFMAEAEVKPFMLGQRSGGASGSTDKLASTTAGAGGVAVARPAVIHHYEESRAHDLEKPLTTITACNEHGLIKATIIDCFGSGDAADMEALLPTVTGEGRHGLACPVVAQVNHGKGELGDKDNNRRSTPVNQPLLTLTTTRGLVLANATITALNTAENRTLTPSHSSCPTSAGPKAMIPGAMAPTTPSRASPAGEKKPGDDIMDQAIATALDESGRDPMSLVFIDPSPLLATDSACWRTGSRPGPWDSTGNKPASSMATGGGPPGRSATPCR